MVRAVLDPVGAYGRHPLQPHQLTDRVTRVEDTIVLCHLGVPRIDPADWSLVIDGLVRRPLQLTLPELMRRRQVEIASVHQCCGSPLRPEMAMRRVCNVVWRGVRLADLLGECEPEPAARYLWSRGADFGVFEGDLCEAYIKDLPLHRAAADVLVAHAMNGAPVRPENGYPVRLVVPGYYGTNSVKWLERITLAAERAPGPFTTRWYNDAVLDAAGRPTGATAPVGSIAPESVIVSPAPGATVEVGRPTEIWGWAWSDGGVGAVEVGIGTAAEWLSAAIEPAAGRAWRRFTVVWTPQRNGDVELCCRAWALGGRTQPPAGARNAIHRVGIRVA